MHSHILFLTSFIVMCSCGQEPAELTRQPLTTSVTEGLTGCYEAPQGDDNRNLYRFEPTGDARYLDTWNQGAGLPTERLQYQLQGGQLSLGGGAPMSVSVEPSALVFVASGQRWEKVECSAFTW